MPQVPVMHPPAQRLADYSLGKLNDTDSDQIHGHLDACEPCRRALKSQRAKDTLVELLQQPSTVIEAPKRPAAAASPTKYTGLAQASIPQGAPPTRLPSTASFKQTTFGRYVVEDMLGEGGMGAVYRAYDPELQRQVAVKVPRFRSESPELLARFRHEAKIAATFKHPHLCPVYDVGEESGTQYLVMPLIDGEPLAALISSTRKKGKELPERQVALLVRKLAQALDHAHQKGVIHRDLKPGNIMMHKEGGKQEPLIMDFGLARNESAQTHLTQSGMIMGTPAYMAPEQAGGLTQQIGPAADIYSLGVILYELLTLTRPFEEPSAYQIITQSPEAPSKHRPKIDAKLEVICLKALAKKPEERQRSMAEMAGVLEEWLRTNAGSKTSSVMGNEQSPTAARRSESVYGSEGPDVFADLNRPIQSTPPMWHALAKGSRRRRLFLIGGGAAAIAAAALTIVILLRTEEGTVRIEVAHKDLVVTIDGKEIRVNNPVPMKAGDHVLAIQLGDSHVKIGDMIPFGAQQKKLVVRAGEIELTSDRFTVTRGAEVVVRVSLEPGPVAANLKPDPIKPLPIKQSVWPADALREGRIVAPDLSKAKVLFRDEFDNPNSGFRTGSRKDPGGFERHTGYEGGRYFVRVVSKSGFGFGTGFVKGEAYSDFALEVVGRAHGPSPSAWGLFITNWEDPKTIERGKYSIYISFDREGKMTVAPNLTIHARGTRGPELGPIRHPAIKGGEEFNRILVVVRGRSLEIYANSLAVCDPILLDEDITPAQISLAAIEKGNGASAEFERMVVYSAKGLATPAGKIAQPAPVAPPFAWPAEALREGRIPAPDLRKAKVHHEDEFDDPKNPKSRFEISKTEGYQEDYEKGKYVIKYFSKGLTRAHRNVTESWGECAYEVVARLDGASTDFWELQINNFQHNLGVAVRVHNNGVMSVWPGATNLLKDAFQGPKLNPFSHSAVNKDGEWNTLLLIARKGSIELYMNGKAVCNPIAVDPSFDPNRLQLTLGSSGPAQVEFERLKVYDAKGLPAPQERLKAILGKLNDGPAVKSDQPIGEDRLLKGHTDAVFSVAFSTDEHQAVSAGDDKTIRLWNLQTGEEIRRFSGHGDKVPWVSVSADGKHLLSASRDNTVRFWETASGNMIKLFPGHSHAVFCAIFSNDGRHAYSCSYDRTIRKWDLASGLETQKFDQHSSFVRMMALSPDGQFIVTGSGENDVHLWDVRTGKAIQALTGHESQATGVAFSRDGRRIISGSHDATARLWELKSGKTIHLLAGHKRAVHSVALSSDGRQALTGSYDRTLILWDLETGRHVHQFTGHTNHVNSVAFSPDGRYALSGSKDNTVRRWRLPAVKD